MGILNSSETEVTDLQVAVLVDEDVAGLEIAMNDTGRVNILETALYMIGQSKLLGERMRLPQGSYQNLIEEVLDELLLKRSRCEQSVEIGSQKLSDEVTSSVLELAKLENSIATHMSSRGEMKMSLSEMTCCRQHQS